MGDFEIRNISISVEQAFHEGLEESLAKSISGFLGSKEFKLKGILRKSIDARHRSRVSYNISALVSVDGHLNTGGNIFPYKEYEYKLQEQGTEELHERPVIIGSGPCGLFCAYILAVHGFKPMVIERGSVIQERRKKVRAFWSGLELDEETNVQFGEGGAGTFSDGKLVTRINDPRSRFVLLKMTEAGADRRILYESKPHIGTDRLIGVIENIRNEIIGLGGTFLFDTKVTDISTKNGKIKSIKINDSDDISAQVVIAAIGHSSRDTYGMLFKNEIAMEQKQFSAGLRIEHLQKVVDETQWGRDRKYLSEAAEYSANCKMPERNAYTFCMCPGGVVVNAASEKGMLTVNGMSYSGRDGINSNSAWVAEVKAGDFPSSHPLAGIELQRQMEAMAFSAAGRSGIAPVQKLADFIEGRKSLNFGRIKPSFTGDTVFSDLNGVLPVYLSKALKGSLRSFSSRLPFFNDPDAVLTGTETRTSSPVRIIRDENMQSPGITGLYPAGEGAGYAGGIMSAAVDGIKVAEEIVKRYNYLG